MLEVRLLGKFSIQYDGMPVVLSSRIAQSLFAYLIISAGIPHRREKLAGMFWPDAREDKARAYLRHELWRIRKALPTKADYLNTDDIGISFNLTSEYSLDLTELKNLRESPSVTELTTVLSSYRGELLPGFYEEWVSQEREHVHALFDQKMGQLLNLLEGEKRWPEILDWAERWISFGGATESAYRFLMIAHKALGDQGKVALTYERCVQALRELDLEPSEETRAIAFKQISKLNIPIPLTSFIGREQELKEVAELFSKSRLITLAGSGGVGKTRLAIQVVPEVMDRFPDGIWFLDLAPLSDPALVPNTLASLLGLRESADAKLTDLLIHYFHSLTALIIFDNCEHLIEACAELISSLITSCNGIWILATSREALRISGEVTYRVPSLETPKPNDELGIADLSNLESINLFVQRSAHALQGFTINVQNAHDIAQICQRLDGIPLAIELAAARVNVLTVEQISKRLDDRLNLLSHGWRNSLPRHQTLRAMIEWSYDLLSEQEQLLFRRLAVFMGGWTLESAEEVCSGDGISASEILDLLTQLINKSLVLVETTNGVARYRRLESIRQFAREKFLETNEVSELRDRHLIYFLKKAEEIEPYLMGSEQASWMDYIDVELDNIRLALEWSTSNNRGDDAFRLFGALGWFWFIRCYIQEGINWFNRVSQLNDRVSKRAQAKILGTAGWLHYAKDDFSAAFSFHQASLELYRQLDDENGVSTQLQFLGPLQFNRGNKVEARQLLEESLHMSRRINNRSAMPRVLLYLGFLYEMEQEYVTARQHYEEGLAICRELHEGHLTSLLLSMMGNLAFEEKNIRQARDYYEEALEICIRLKNKRTTAETLLELAKILYAEGQYSDSAQLQGFVRKLFGEGESLTQPHLMDIKKTAEPLKSYLGDESYQKEFDKGKSLNLEEAVEIAVRQKE